MRIATSLEALVLPGAPSLERPLPMVMEKSDTVPNLRASRHKVVPAQENLGVLRPIRILVADDSSIVLRSISRYLDSIPGVQLVAVATVATEALEMADRHHPDLVLIDLAMPGMNGLEATRILADRQDAPRIILMSVNDASCYREAAAKAGAYAFMLKSDMGSLVEPLINQLRIDQQGSKNAPYASMPWPEPAERSPRSST